MGLTRSDTLRICKINLLIGVFVFIGKNSKFAIEAMEGLQTKVNLTEASTALRKTAKNVEGISTELQEFGGFLPVMLLHIKGI